MLYTGRYRFGKPGHANRSYYLHFTNAIKNNMFVYFERADFLILRYYYSLRRVQFRPCNFTTYTILFLSLSCFNRINQVFCVFIRNCMLNKWYANSVGIIRSFGHYIIKSNGLYLSVSTNR